jgi:hypothetical protein
VRLRRFALASVTALACACAQIAGLGDPTELAGAAIDATTGGDTSSPVVDAGGVPDSPADAALDVTADGACANAIFCEDFDDDAGIAEWTRQDSGSGNVQLVTNPVASPPRAMRAVNSGTGEAQLARIVPIGDGISCEMSVRVSSWSGEGYFFELGLDPVNKGGFDWWWIDVGKAGGEALLLEYSWNGSSDTNSSATWTAPLDNTWVRVRVDVRLRNGAPGVRVLFDGVEKAQRNLVVPSSTTYLLASGIGLDKSSTADDFVIDDVICRAL